MKSQLEELEEAAAEQRQPICVWCKQPLQRIEQTFYEYVVFEWDDNQKKYVKLIAQPSGDCDKPYHVSCGATDWDFIESGDATAKLGLTY
jgi:hypothetical protein